MFQTWENGFYSSAILLRSQLMPYLFKLDSARTVDKIPRELIGAHRLNGSSGQR